MVNCMWQWPSPTIQLLLQVGEMNRISIYLSLSIGSSIWIDHSLIRLNNITHASTKKPRWQSSHSRRYESLSNSSPLPPWWNLRKKVLQSFVGTLYHWFGAIQQDKIKSSLLSNSSASLQIQPPSHGYGKNLLEQKSPFSTRPADKACY